LAGLRSGCTEEREHKRDKTCREETQNHLDIPQGSPFLADFSFTLNLFSRLRQTREIALTAQSKSRERAGYGALANRR
jgi:hypothetical protein